jgi:hypothetical protein
MSKRRRHYLHPVEATVGGERQMYGFQWGPLRVVRLVHVEGRGYLVTLQTEYQSMEIWASEGGRKLYLIGNSK